LTGTGGRECPAYRSGLQRDARSGTCGSGTSPARTARAAGVTDVATVIEPLSVSALTTRYFLPGRCLIRGWRRGHRRTRAAGEERHWEGRPLDHPDEERSRGIDVENTQNVTVTPRVTATINTPVARHWGVRLEEPDEVDELIIEELTRRDWDQEGPVISVVAEVV
jgi:hypothetical protein